MTAVSNGRGKQKERSKRKKAKGEKQWDRMWVQWYSMKEESEMREKKYRHHIGIIPALRDRNEVRKKGIV